jgi:drug/metabolite transporter (DMT)-like permease
VIPGSREGRPTPPRPRLARPLWVELGLVGMVTIWGLNFAVVKSAFLSFELLGFNALRHVLASLFLLLVLWRLGGVGWPARRDWQRIVLLGAVGNIAYQMAFIYGLDRTRAGNAALMLALIPIFLLLAEDRGTTPKRAWMGAFVSIAGVALVSGSSLRLEGVDTLIGDLILVGAAAVWAAYTTGAKPLIGVYGPLRTTAYTLWVGSVGLVLVGIPALVRQDWGAVSGWAWGELLFSSVLSIGVAYLLWYRGVQRLGGPRTAVFSNLTPVVALLAGALWLGERLTPASVLGASMVVGGILLVRRREMPAPPLPAGPVGQNP